MKKILITGLLVLLSFVGLAARAETVVSNIGAPSVGGNNISSEFVAATLFQMNAGDDYRLDSVATQFANNSNEAAAQTIVQIYSHSSDTDPFAGSLVASLNPNPLTGTSFGSTFTTVTFTPATLVQLVADTKYWVVVTGLNTNSLQMNRTATQPTGTAGAAISSWFYNGSWIDMSSSWSNWSAISINASTGAAVESIPTLSEWGMIILSGLLALSTVFVLRRKHG